MQSKLPKQSFSFSGVLLSSILSLLLGLVVLTGWYTHNLDLIQVNPAFVPMQIEALADDRYQVCRALSVALSRIGPSIFYDVI